VQLARRAAYPPGDAREDWAILRALSERLGKTLPFDTLDQVRDRLVHINRSFAAVDQQEAGGWGTFGATGPIGDAMFASPIGNFYMTCAISRSSRTMAECIASREEFAKRSLERARRMG